MEYINHITLNTGHIRKTTPNEVNKEIYFILNRIYKESFSKNGAKIFDKYVVKSTNSDIGVIFTLFDEQGIPIITSGISKNDYKGELWKMLHETTEMPMKTSPNQKPALPYIADRLEFGAMFHMNALQWTGDFSKCMGWITLAPDKIR